MKFMSFGTDGGKNSGVIGFWLIEIKWLFSIVFLKFAKGTRENYHSHAFNAYTWFLSGKVEEQHVKEKAKIWSASLVPKYTPKSTFHRVNALETTYAISFRGPWNNYWYEYNPNDSKYIKLTHGRNKIGEQATPFDENETEENNNDDVSDTNETDENNNETEIVNIVDVDSDVGNKKEN